MSEEAQPLDASLQGAEDAFATLITGSEEPEVPAESEELEAEQTEEDADEYLDDEETEGEVEAEQPQKYALPFGDNGELVEVDQAELQNYVLRQQDYTKKTQEVAAARKQLDEERNSLRAIQSLANQLQDEYDNLKTVEDAERSDDYWEQLKTENPMQFLV